MISPWCSSRSVDFSRSPVKAKEENDEISSCTVFFQFEILSHIYIQRKFLTKDISNISNILYAYIQPVIIMHHFLWMQNIKAKVDS